MASRGLTEKQKRFVDYYIETGNAAEASRKAGYKSPVIGRENLRKLTVQNAIAERMKTIEGQRVASATEVLQYLTAVMRGEAKEEIAIQEGCGSGYTETKLIKKEISQRDRLKAAELLMKRLGLGMSDIEQEEKKVRIESMRKNIDRDDGDKEGVQIINDYSKIE